MQRPTESFPPVNTPGNPPGNPSGVPPDGPSGIPAVPFDSRLDAMAFESRKVLLFGAVDDASAAAAVGRLAALDHVSASPITVLVSSPGGHVESGDAIHNMVRFVRPPVTMVGSGWVGSAALHVFLAVPAERRVSLPHTRFLIHQPSGGIGGSASDIATQAREILRTRERIARVIAEATGRSPERVLRDIERDHWMSAEEAIEYGLVSRIVEREDELAG